MAALNAFLSGGILIVWWTISLFFFRFHKRTGDRLFGFFAAAFLLLGLECVCGEFMSNGGEPYVYLIRLAAFVLILKAIWQKNSSEKKN